MSCLHNTRKCPSIIQKLNKKEKSHANNAAIRSKLHPIISSYIFIIIHPRVVLLYQQNFTISAHARSRSNLTPTPHPTGSNQAPTPHTLTSTWSKIPIMPRAPRNCPPTPLQPADPLTRTTTATSPRQQNPARIGWSTARNTGFPRPLLNTPSTFFGCVGLACDERMVLTDTSSACSGVCCASRCEMRSSGG